jgi:hypothetical protein
MRRTGGSTCDGWLMTQFCEFSEIPNPGAFLPGEGYIFPSKVVSHQSIWDPHPGFEAGDSVLQKETAGLHADC